MASRGIVALLRSEEFHEDFQDGPTESMSPKADGRKETAIIPRVKVWLEVNGEFIFSTGMCQILEAVERTGSIKEAAESIGLSYRHVWARIKEVESATGIPLVRSQVGGHGSRRTSLTEYAQTLISSFTRLRSRMTAYSDACADEFIAEMKRVAASPENQVH